MPMSPKFLRPRASGFHPEAQAWQAAVVANGGTVSSTTLKAVSDFCRSIDSAGLRDRFYRLSLMCGGFSGVFIPLYRGRSRTGTQFGNTTDTNSGGVFVSGDYADNLGLLGSSGAPRKFLATGVDNSVLGATGHMAYYGSGDMTSGTTRRAMECLPAGGDIWVLDQRASSRLFFNYGTGASFSSDTALSGSGLRLAQRTSATSMQAFYAGVEQADETGTSTNSVTVNNSVAGSFNVFSSGANFPYRISAYSLGLTMTASQVAAYNTAMVAFQTALGRA